MGELILGGKGTALPAHLQNAQVNKDEWAVLGGPRIPSLEVTAEVIRAVVGDQVLQETEDPINIMVVGASKVARVFYRAQYDKDAAPTLPDCYSADGVVPADNAQEPQASSCDKCEQNIKGSSPGLAGSKACRYRQNLAVVLPALPDKLFRLSISATGIFPPEKTRSGHLAFAPFGQQLIASNVTPDMVMVELKRDLSLGNIRSVFKATSYLEADEYQMVQDYKQSAEYAQILDMHMTNVNTASASGGNVVAGAQTRSYEDDDLPAELQGKQSRQTRMDKAGVTEANLAYAKDPSGETDPKDTYWVCEHDGTVVMVPAGDPLPDFSAYLETDENAYNVAMEVVRLAKEKEAARIKAEADAKEAERKEAEKAKLAAAKAKADAAQTSRSTNRRSTVSDALPVGNDFVKDPGRFVDDNETYWVNKKVKGNVFSVPAGVELPDANTYTEVSTRVEATSLYEAAKVEAQTQQAEAKSTRRTAAANPQGGRRTTADAAGAGDTSHRRQHNRTTTASSEEAVHRRTTSDTAGNTLAGSISALGDEE